MEFNIFDWFCYLQVPKFHCDWMRAMNYGCNFEEKNIICGYCHKSCCSSFCPEREKEKFTFALNGKVLTCFRKSLEQHCRGRSSLESLSPSSSKHSPILTLTSSSTSCGNLLFHTLLAPSFLYRISIWSFYDVNNLEVIILQWNILSNQ